MPDRDFSGVDRSGQTAPRSGPVQFEREEDPFGLDQFLNQAKRAPKAQKPDDANDDNKRRRRD